MRGQLEKLVHVRDFMIPWAKIQAMLEERDNRQKQTMKEDICNVMAELLAQLPRTTAFVKKLEGKLIDADGSLRESLSLVDALDFAKLLEIAEQFQTKLLQQWEKDCEDLVKAINGWIPNWQVHKQELLKHPEVHRIHSKLLGHNRVAPP